MDQHWTLCAIYLEALKNPNMSGALMLQSLHYAHSEAAHEKRTKTPTTFFVTKGHPVKQPKSE
jgi:hypothetical protein